MSKGEPNVDFDLGMPIHEIGWIREAGMAPMQIIISATRNSARSCNGESEFGTLEVGKVADILVMDGDPLDDIQVFINTHLVLREGRAV